MFKKVISKKYILFLVTSLLLLSISAGLVIADYTYVLTVGMDPNDPNCDPNDNYETINAAIVAMNAKSPPLDSNTLGCIEVYPEPNGSPRTYIEHLNDHYDPNGHNLPAYCDLTGMGDDIDDVIIQHGGYSNTAPEIRTEGIVCNGDNIISNLKLLNKYIYGSSYVQEGIRFIGNGELNNCIVISLHGPAIEGFGNLIVSNCPEISATWLECIRANSTFEISNCTININSGSQLEWPIGIVAGGSGLIDNVSISGICANTHAIKDDIFYNERLYGIELILGSDETVLIKDSEINLVLSNNYYSNQEPSRVCGIASAGGKVVVRDTIIDVTGIEDVNVTDPNYDGAGIMVDGISVRASGTVEVWGYTDITTSRTTASHAEDGNEYSLNNENGTLAADGDPNLVSYDPNKTNGTITDLARAVNVTDDVNYISIQDAIDNSSNNDVIEVPEGVHYETIDFGGKAITVRSADPNDWDVVAATIIDVNNANSVGVTFDSGEGATSILTGLTVAHANDYGIYCEDEDMELGPTITRCIIRDNYGDGIYSLKSMPNILNCKIFGNSACGIYAEEEESEEEGAGLPTIKGCWIYDNGTDGIGGNSGGEETESEIVIQNNTIVNNTNAGIDFDGDSTITNCILWGNGDDLTGGCSATYSCIEDADSGTGNIGGDANNPDFLDPNNNDYHLSLFSPCVNAGDPSGNYVGQLDIDGHLRDIRQVADIGADEFVWVHNLDQNTWHGYIQDAIDNANNGDELVAVPDTYYEAINFGGKAITVRGTDPNDWDVVAATVIDVNDANSYGVQLGGGLSSTLAGLTVAHANDAGITAGTETITNCIIRDNYGNGIYTDDAPTVINCKIYNNRDTAIGANGDDCDPIVKNCLIYRNSVGIAFEYGDNAEIHNNTIVYNPYGGIASGDGDPAISNCILWGNGDDLYGCNATYSCIEDGDAGTGNISSDPNFIDDVNDNYHLNSGSPCIDVGDPNGWYEGQYDIDGDPRVIGDPNEVDMGADEYDPGA